ncbi:hypothetical protein D3C81_1027410 [compost metagenome]
MQAAAQGLGLLDIGAQGKGLFVLAQLEQVGIELAQLAQATEMLADAVQRGNADGCHRQGQQQYQGKAQAQLAGHAQVGQKTLPARLHTPPPCSQDLQRPSVATIALNSQGLEDAIVSNSYERVVISLLKVAPHAKETTERGHPAHERH